MKVSTERKAVSGPIYLVGHSLVPYILVEAGWLSEGIGPVYDSHPICLTICP